MAARLKTLASSTHADVAAFFDAAAPAYSEQHGPGERLLRYRLDLIREVARFAAADTVLEIGCGNGLHLLGLSREFNRGLGVDLSPAMIDAARAVARDRGQEQRVIFAVDKGEHLSSVEDASVDVVFCVGALEHMLDQRGVFRSASRVLRSGGRFVCLTLNGASLWYRWLGPALRYDTRRLSTDHYLSCAELRQLAQAGFGNQKIDSWTFIQKGDMPKPVARLLELADHAGRIANLVWLRGGLRLLALK